MNLANLRDWARKFPCRATSRSKKQVNHRDSRFKCNFNPPSGGKSKFPKRFLSRTEKWFLQNILTSM